jgi:hypothetical protein
MLNAPTLEQLQTLKLATMATAWTEQQQQADMTALAFDERFALLVDAEWRARENKRLTRALQDAKLKLSQACLEAIDSYVTWYEECVLGCTSDRWLAGALLTPDPRTGCSVGRNAACWSFIRFCAASSAKKTVVAVGHAACLKANFLCSLRSSMLR